MLHFDETFLWNILMIHFDETLDGTFWWDILMRRFNYAFWWDFFLAGNGWKFFIVIKLLNCTTGLSYFTQSLALIALALFQYMSPCRSCFFALYLETGHARHSCFLSQISSKNLQKIILWCTWLHNYWENSAKKIT